MGKKAKFATRAFPERKSRNVSHQETVKHYRAFHYTAEKEKHRVTRYSYYEPMYEFLALIGVMTTALLARKHSGNGNAYQPTR